MEGLVVASTLAPYAYAGCQTLFSRSRHISQKQKVCIVGGRKSGKTSLSKNIEHPDYLILDLDDLSSYLSKDEVEKLESLKDTSLYRPLYYEIVKNAYNKIKDIQLKSKGKKLLCFCGDFELARMLFKPESIYICLHSYKFLKSIIDGVNDKEEKESIRRSREILLQHLHKNVPVFIFDSFDHLQKTIEKEFNIQPKI